MMITCERCRENITEEVRAQEIDVPPQGLICDDCCEAEESGNNNLYQLGYLGGNHEQ